MQTNAATYNDLTPLATPQQIRESYDKYANFLLSSLVCKRGTVEEDRYFDPYARTVNTANDFEMFLGQTI